MSDLRKKIEEILESHGQEFLNEIDQETDQRVVSDVATEILEAFSAFGPTGPTGPTKLTELREELTGLASELEEIGKHLDTKVVNKALGATVPKQVKALATRFAAVAKQLVPELAPAAISIPPSDSSERVIWECVDDYEPRENGHTYSLWTTGDSWGCMDQTLGETLIIGFASKDDAIAYAAETEIQCLQEAAMDQGEEYEEAGERG